MSRRFLINRLYFGKVPRQGSRKIICITVKRDCSRSESLNDFTRFSTRAYISRVPIIRCACKIQYVYMHDPPCGCITDNLIAQSVTRFAVEENYHACASGKLPLFFNIQLACSERKTVRVKVLIKDSELMNIFVTK